MKDFALIAQAMGCRERQIVESAVGTLQAFADSGAQRMVVFPETNNCALIEVDKQFSVTDSFLAGRHRGVDHPRSV
jgi:hypothetical protein